MISLYLKRFTEYDGATFGVLCVDGAPTCVTLEPPWRDNKKAVSCIPTGNYSLYWKQSPRFGRVLEIVGVPNRAHILIHAGNLPKDTSGCILVGSEFGEIEGRAAILESKKAIQKLHTALAAPDEKIITIVK